MPQPLTPNFTRSNTNCFTKKTSWLIKTISVPLLQGLSLCYSIIRTGKSWKTAIKFTKCSLTFPLHHSHYQSTEMKRVTLNTHLHYFLLVSAKRRTIKVTLLHYTVVSMEPFKSIFLYQAQFEASYFLALVAMSYSRIQKIQKANEKLFSSTLHSCTNILLQSHDYNTTAFQPVKLHVL